MIDEKNVVLFHANCHDGFASAWAASRLLMDRPFLIPVRYNVNYSTADLLPENNGRPAVRLGDLADKNVFVLDFSFSPSGGLVQILREASCVFILDHHKTAFENLAFVEQFLEDDISEKEFIRRCMKDHRMSEAEAREFMALVAAKLNLILDNKMSGAGLSWEFFCPNRDQPVPAIIQHVQDRDLWSWKLDKTRPFMMNLASLPMKLGQYDELHEAFTSQPESYDRFVEEGKAMCRLFDQYISQLKSDYLKLVEIDGFRGLVVNASPMFVSELGNALVEKVDFALIWGFSNHRNDILVGLRSKAGGNCDVSKIAKDHFGGGGHFAAAGGRSNFKQIQDILERGTNVKFASL